MLTGQILLQLMVILIVVQVFGHLSGRIGQQWVIGEILAGIALGPSLLGAFLPGIKAMVFPANALATLQTLGDIGLVFYMFSLGSRLDTEMMLRHSRKAIVASLSSIVLPLGLGAVLAFALYPAFAGPNATRISFMLLVGTAMSITAFPVLARLLTEKNMLNTKVGTLALTSAAIGDVVAWCMLALVIAVVQAKGVVSGLMTIGLTVIFIGIMFAVVRPLLAYTARRFATRPSLLVALTLILLMLSAYTTNQIGVHPVFGAFLTGLILPRKAAFIEQVRSLDQVNNVIFLPLFFVSSGLHTQIGLISAPYLWLICLLVLAVACVGKILGATLSVRWMGDSWRESLTLGTLMNTRGLIELIVLNIGLSLGVLSPSLFAMLVIMAVVTTMMASPLLSLLGHRQKGQPEHHVEISGLETEEALQ